MDRRHAADTSLRRARSAAAAIRNATPAGSATSATFPTQISAAACGSQAAARGDRSRSAREPSRRTRWLARRPGRQRGGLARALQGTAENPEQRDGRSPRGREQSTGRPSRRFLGLGATVAIPDVWSVSWHL